MCIRDRNGASFNGLAGGNYTVIATDSSGCADTTNATLTAPMPISITGIVTNATTPSNGSIDINVTGGTAPYSYNWNPGGSNTQNLNGIPGNATYSITVTDANGCLADTSFFVDSSVGLAGFDAPLAVACFPNPTTGILTIRNGKGLQRIQVVGLAGHVVQETGPQSTIDLRTLDNGIYLIRFTATDGRYTQQRIVKQ